MIDSRMRDLKGLTDKMDKVKDRLYLSAYSLLDFDGKTPLNDVINVTENKSATYVTRIVAGLMAAQWQGVVAGSVTKREAKKIEQFIEDSLEQGDEYMLNKFGLAGLNAWLCNHVCTRSLIGVQWMSYVKEGEYIVECLPVDMRWTPFVLNKWVAPITFRSKEDLLQELEGYKEAPGVYKEPGELKDLDNEVRDFWDGEKNELWIEGQLVFEQPSPYKKPPFVIVFPPSGFMFRDKGYLEHESPSLLFLNEGLYDEISRQLSIDATLGFEPVVPRYEYETELPKSGPSDAPPERGATLARKTGELHKLVPRPDVNTATLASREEILRLVDEAAPIAPRAYTQPPSAIEVTTEVELLNQLQNPRIKALEMLKEQLARLMIEQFMEVEGEVLVGKTGRKRQHSMGELKDPDKYTISYRLMTKNKRLEIVNEARFLALYGKAPLDFLLRDVLMVEDPDGWTRALELEEARQADPALALFEMALRYVEEAEDTEDKEGAELKRFESMMLVDRGVAIVKQRMEPAPLPQEAQTPTPEKPKGNAGGLVSLVSKGQPEGVI